MECVKNLSLIVAVSEDNAIGDKGDLLCRLSSDLKRFKALTTGHTIIMGRKTFESLPKGALPNRRNIVISRNPEFRTEGAETARTIEEALEMSKNDGERFIIGGAQLYDATIGLAETIHLTRIHHSFPEADTRLKNFNIADWETTDSERHSADDRNEYDYSFITLSRKQ